MDEIDFLLVNALQVHPRVSWAQLESIIGVDSTVLSRRWSRLREEGIAWSSCFAIAPGATLPTMAVAFVEVDCVAGERERVIEAVSKNRAVITVECTSGSRELFLTLAISNVGEVDAYVSGELTSIPGVSATRTHFSRRFFKDGSGWRLHVLREWQLRQLRELRSGAGDVPPAPTPVHLQVIEALAADIRRPATAVAAEIGRSPSTTNRAIAQVVHAPWVRTRVDFAHNLAGFYSIAVLWLQVPHPELEHVGAALSVMPETRMCVSVVGRANLLVTLWLRKLSDYDEIENKLVRNFPSTHVDDRWIIPRVAKRLGYVLQADGRSSHFVT